MDFNDLLSFHLNHVAFTILTARPNGLPNIWKSGSPPDLMNYIEIEGTILGMCWAEYQYLRFSSQAVAALPVHSDSIFLLC